MNRPTALLCTLLTLLPACVPHPPEIPYPAASPDPLVRSLNEHRQRFSSLKALARVETERNGKRRAYESVAIVQHGYDRIRVEGYGPVGETIFALLWNGTDVLVLPPDGSGARTIGPGGFERLLGVGLAPEDLCAVLVGGAPRVADAAGTVAGCSTDGRCILDVGAGSDRWRVHMRPLASGTVEIDAIERYHGDQIAFLVRYEGSAGVGTYSLPRRVIVQDPGRRSTLTVEYLDAEVNAALADSLFLQSGPLRREQ